MTVGVRGKLRQIERKLIDLPKYLACEYVEQAPYADSINPDSANTIRIVTIFDREGNEYS